MSSRRYIICSVLMRPRGTQGLQTGCFVIHMAYIRTTETCGRCNVWTRLKQAAVGKRRAPGDSKPGLKHLLPSGLTQPERYHISLSLPGFYPILAFACSIFRLWGPALPVCCQPARRLLRRLVHAFHAVEAFLVDRKCAHGRTTRSPVAVAVFTVLCDWQDVLSTLLVAAATGSWSSLHWS